MPPTVRILLNINPRELRSLFISSKVFPLWTRWLFQCSLAPGHCNLPFSPTSTSCVSELCINHYLAWSEWTLGWKLSHEAFLCGWNYILQKGRGAVISAFWMAYQFVLKQQRNKYIFIRETEELQMPNYEDKTHNLETASGATSERSWLNSGVGVPDCVGYTRLEGVHKITRVGFLKSVLPLPYVLR